MKKVLNFTFLMKDENIVDVHCAAFFTVIKKRSKDIDSFEYFGFGKNFNGELRIDYDRENKFVPTNLHFKDTKEIACGTEIVLLFKDGGYSPPKFNGYGFYIPQVEQEAKYFEEDSVEKIFCGHGKFFFATQNGAVFAFGKNIFSSLGLGNMDCSFQFEPFKIKDFGKVRSVAIGFCHTLFLTESEQVYGCGSNSGKF